jgi:hypothetical protein
MEFLFLLVLVLAAFAVVGSAVFALAWWGRRRKLSPRGDEVEGVEERRGERPDHVAVDTEQRARFIGTR